MYPYSATIPNKVIWKKHADLSQDDIDYILHNYHYMNLRELANAVGVSLTKVHRILKQKGISRKKGYFKS